MLSRVALQGVIRALQLDIYNAIPPAFSSPLISKDLPGPAAACVYFHDNRFSSTGWAVPQSVRCITFRLQAIYLSATSHHRQKVVPSQKSIYETFLVAIPPVSSVWAEHFFCHSSLCTCCRSSSYVCKQTHGEEVHTKAGSNFAAKRGSRTGNIHLRKCHSSIFCIVGRSWTVF